MKKPPAIFLMGPTGIGKTQAAVELVQRFPCDIISVDSAMVYRGMDIGTAKPSAELLQRAPHRLIDIRDPATAYSAGNFCKDALREMQDITAKGRIPLLVGGTLLYYKVLYEGMAQLPAANAQIRQQLARLAAEQGWEQLHQQLQRIDPLAAQRIRPTDTQRLQRALEVYELTGETLSQLQQRHKNAKADFAYRVQQLALLPIVRQDLHKSIAQRFQEMIQQGLIEEVQRLYQREDLTADLPALRTVGYRQVWQYLDKKISYEEMLERGIIATRQLVKRQLTWLRSWVELETIESDTAHRMDILYSSINRFLTI